MHHSVDEWLTTKQLAKYTGLSERTLRLAFSRAHNGHPWNGHNLEVCKNLGKGGASGIGYMVRIGTLPLEIQATLGVCVTNECEVFTGHNGRFNHDLSPTKSAKHINNKDHQAEFKLDLIRPIFQTTPPKTAERASLIRSIAETATYPYGSKRGSLVGESSIRKWLTDYEREGVSALMRKGRSDVGKGRTILSRRWDQALTEAGIPINKMQEIAGKIRKGIRSEWSNGTPSWPTVQLNLLPVAVSLSHQAGLSLPPQQMQSVCEVPRSMIEAERRYALVDMRRNDAAGFAAKVTPRIRRDRSHLLPMEWIAADVHHLDLYFRREDGTLCTPKAVAWMDLATNRAFLDVFVMPKGEMIRREHVIQSFVNLCTDPEWGVPSRIYTDNGGEYNWIELTEDLAKLKHSIELRVGDDLDRNLGVQRAKPYAPQSKVIESLFSALERVAFAQLPGYVGGNRMKKKTQNQGKEPAHFPGDETALKDTIQVALNYYHHKKQSGQFKGMTPDGLFRVAVQNGWRSTLLERHDLAVAFSKEIDRIVNTGGKLKVDGIEFYAEELLSHVGRRVNIRQPLFDDSEMLFVFSLKGEPLAVAIPEITFPFGDGAGAAEQSHRAAILRSQLNQLADQTGDRDIQETMRAVADQQRPKAVQPDSPVIQLAEPFREMGRKVRLTRPRTPKEKQQDYEQISATRGALLSKLVGNGG